MNKTAFLLAVTLVFSPAWGKDKKKEEHGLKKVVAIGMVNSGQLSFQQDNPMGLSGMLEEKIKQQIEMTGRYAAVILETAKEAEPDGGTTNNDFLNSMQAKQDAGKQMTPQEAMKYSEILMKQQMATLGPMMQQLGGGNGVPFKPVPSQVLLTFAVTTGQGGMDTGGVVSTVGGMLGSSLGGGLVGDFGTQSQKMTLTCVMQDPDTGNVIDQNIVQTKSSQFTRFGGVTTVDDSGDRDKTYDKLFKKAVEKCVQWMDTKVSKQPWDGRVFKVEGGRAFLNAGSNAGVQTGMQFDLLGRSQVSGGGVEFGKEEHTIGTATATEVNEGYSILSSGAKTPIKVGTIVRPVAVAPYTE